MIRVLRYTGFQTPTEYFRETTFLDREFFARAVKEYEREEEERWAKRLKALRGG
jgi:hypothetical protein